MAEHKKVKVERIPAPKRVIAYGKTPVGGQVQRVKVRADGLYLNGKPLVGAKPEYAIVIVRKGLLGARSFIAYYVDGASNTVLPPPSGGAVDPDTARVNMILGSIVANIALSRRKEQLLLCSVY